MTEAMSAAMARASFSPLTGDAATGIRSSPGNSFFLQTWEQQIWSNNNNRINDFVHL
jgi:hypothetical protein